MTEALARRHDSIDRFAADVAHELKNPLTSLKSAVETAARVPDPAVREKLMAIVLDDVQRLDRLITDISGASRLDAELSRADAETLDVAALLEGLCDALAAVAKEGQAKPVYEGPAGGGFLISGVADRLTQVFRNVIGNAQSFSPPGADIRVGVTRDRGWIVVRIDDEGPGIPDDKLEAIFDRFYSERPANEKFGTHSGLGLSISRQIVEAHGGRQLVWLEHAEIKIGIAGLNQREATKAGGLYGTIIGDYRRQGRYTSYQAECISRMPSDELAAVIIKAQHNVLASSQI
jgi:two-component system sensor histidine kinase ChvG